MLRFFGSVILALFLSSPVWAEYTLVLKNGRRITVQSYREEGGMLKFQGFGGEIGIAKDQVQSILKEAKTEGEGLNIPKLESSTRSAPTPASSPMRSEDAEVRVESVESEAASRTVGGAGTTEYQRRLAEITRDLENVRQRYVSATQGGETSSSGKKEGYKAWTADLMSRLKDRRGAAPSEYEPQEKELSDLRQQIDKLQKQRDALIEEMKSKNIAPAAF